MKHKSKKNRLKKKLRKTKKRGGANLSNAAETNLEKDYKKKFTDPTFKPIRQNIEASNDEQRLQLEEERIWLKKFFLMKSQWEAGWSKKCQKYG